MELADLADSAADAARTASTIWLSLDASEPARRPMAGTADELGVMRQQLAAALRDPELAMQRATMALGADEDIAAA